MGSRTRRRVVVPDGLLLLLSPEPRHSLFHHGVFCWILFATLPGRLHRRHPPGIEGICRHPFVCKAFEIPLRAVWNGNALPGHVPVSPSKMGSLSFNWDQHHLWLYL